jgi:hypothetical protein
VDKHIFDTLSTKNVVEKKEVLCCHCFLFAVEWGIRRVQANQESLKLNGLCQFPVFADDDIYGVKTHLL